MKPSSDPPKQNNPLKIDEEEDDFDIVMHNSGKEEPFNPFAPIKEDSEELVLISTEPNASVSQF